MEKLIQLTDLQTRHTLPDYRNEKKEYDHTIRVYNHSPSCLAIQIRSHCRPVSCRPNRVKMQAAYAHASMTRDQAKELIAMLQKGLEDMA
jgi:hypothetical protein